MAGLFACFMYLRTFCPRTSNTIIEYAGKKMHQMIFCLTWISTNLYSYSSTIDINTINTAV